MAKKQTARKKAKADERDLRIYRLKITLVDTDPPIWRRLEVNSGIGMDSLGQAIDCVFGRFARV